MDLNVEPAPFLWIEEGNGQVPTPRTRRRTKKKKEFVGWGSKQLIEFLESLGKQTAQKIPQHDITNTINQYITERKLLHPEKKKKVMCDERLHALFGRKSVNRNKIHDLLEAHLAENQVGSDDDLFYSSEEKEENVSALNKKQKISSLDRKTVPKKKVVEVSRSSLAAISPENIKLLYLKRTLVQELLKDPEKFESKVVGSFVRIKTDPLDIFQKNSHVIQLVTGVKSVAVAGDGSFRTLLQISGMTDDVSISALSDDNFTEEECDDLRNRVKDGLLKQPTVGEIEQKVKELHEDITKHWLAKELVLLRNLIDRANEKGWRDKVMEYLARRKLLQTSSEQSRLLSEIPKVLPEEAKLDAAVEDSPDAVNQEPNDSPKASPWDWEPRYDSPANGGVIISFSRVPDNQVENVDVVTRINYHAQSLKIEDIGGLPQTKATRPETNGHAKSFEPRERDSPREEAMAAEISVHPKPSTQTTQASNGPLEPLSSNPRDNHGLQGLQNKPVEVIDLSDDDEPPEASSGVQPKTMIPNFLDQLVWYYVDPRHQIQGPFSLSSLKRWKDQNYFPNDFRVWRYGQSPQEAVFLTVILRQFFPS